MDVGGTLNNVTNNMTQNFSKPTDNNYRMTTIQEQLIKEAALATPSLNNPYEEQGVPNSVWKLFDKVSEKSDMYAQKNIEHRLFNGTNEHTNWTEHISKLQENLSQPISLRQLNSLVDEKNIILKQFDQPIMSPSQEKAFRDLIESRQKSQATILDSMMVAISSVTAYEPLEVAA